MSVSEDMKKLKETSASSRPRSKVKVPPVVSVSLSIHPNLITAIMSMMLSLMISVYPEIFVIICIIRVCEKSASVIQCRQSVQVYIKVRV